MTFFLTWTNFFGQILYIKVEKDKNVSKRTTPHLNKPNNSFQAFSS